MTKDQLDTILAMMNKPRNPEIGMSDLMRWNERTLLYGYDVERKTYHTFVRDGRIEHIVYNPTSDTEIEIIFHGRAMRFAADMIVPNKRLYPEACDAEFCAPLAAKGMHLPFTTFNPDRVPAQYHGFVPDPIPA